jgi:hypothetical protein
MNRSFPHRGIRIDSIPVEGGGGLIFALGLPALVWLAVPALQPLLVGCLAAGVAFAFVFHARAH